MKKTIHALLLGFVWIAWAGIREAHPQGQTDAPQITVLDRDGKSVTSIVDGDRLRLRIQLGAAEDAEVKINFSSPALPQPIAECIIPAGANLCESLAFSALGWYWGADGSATPQRTVTASVNGNQITSLSLSVAPRPVVMVHGFISSYKAWTAYLGPEGYLAEIGLQGFAVGDGQVPGVMETGSSTEPNKETNSMAQNADILGEYIRHVQEATGSEKVDLLVHSMGGLISRYYIDRLMTTENVAQLIILGSPMGGSACSILPASLGFFFPASLEIQPNYMVNVFNQQIVRRKGVPFHALAGTKLLDEVASPCTPVPSDVVVTLDSVKAIPMPVEEMPLLHTELNTSPEVFEQFVAPLLKTPPGKFEFAADPPPGSTPPASQQFSKVYNGHLNPGQKQDVVINIDPDVRVANFALYDSSRSLNIVVTGASGRQLELDPVENGIIRIDDPSTMIYLGYGFKQPHPGKWVVTLQTSESTPASGADFAIAAQFHGGALLETALDLIVPRMGETVTITGRLTAEGAAVPLTGATATVDQPDGSIETLAMTVSGNQAELKFTPHLSGLHGIEVSVLANSANGNVIDRAAFLTFDAQPTATETSRNRIIGIVLIVSLLAVLFGLIGMRKRKRTVNFENHIR